MTDTLTGFTPYEYRTLQVAPEQEPLYKDTFANFGWIVEKETAGRPGTTTMALQVKRDRRLPNRQVINELQRQAEDALGTIRDLERSRSAAAITVAVALGIVGSAFLAGSVFAVTAGLVILSVPLGALGLLGWLAGWWSHGRVLARKTAQTAPLIDEQYDIVFGASEQAARLLA